MKWYRRLFEALLLFAAVVLQVGVLSRLQLPGATPDLVLVFVAALGMQRGPLIGAVFGFVGGLMLDLTPPSTGTLGMSALLLLLVGYAAGRFGGDDHAVLRPLFVVAGSAIFYVVGYALLSGLLDRKSLVWATFPQLLLTEVLYALILATFVVPGLIWLERRMAVVSSRSFRDI